MLATIKRTLLMGLLMCPLVVGHIGSSHAQQPAEKVAGTAGAAITEGDDCTKVEIKIDQSDRPLTEAEKAALLDKAFYKSLSRFDRCLTKQSSPNQANTAETGGGSEQSAASQSVEGTDSDENLETSSVSSAASQSLTGTEAKPEPEAGSPQMPDQQPAGLSGQSPATSSSGKLPEDIPPVDNDSVLERQIRAAAMAETDPAVKEKLWNEYRKYKGIPLVKAGSQAKTEPNSSAEGQ